MGSPTPRPGGYATRGVGPQAGCPVCQPCFRCPSSHELCLRTGFCQEVTVRSSGWQAAHALAQPSATWICTRQSDAAMALPVGLPLDHVQTQQVGVLLLRPPG